jgi:DNA-binding NarL/FixJ family response regulator
VNKEKIGVFIVEKHELLREGLLAVLARESDVEVMGVSTDVNDAIRRIQLLQADVVLLDISIVNESGIDTLRDLSLTQPKSKFIALANHSDAESVRTTLTLGVAGYALKHDGSADLMTGIRNVMRGMAYFSPGIAQFVVSSHLGQSTSGANRRNRIPDRRASRRDRRLVARIPNAADLLTNRERQVITLIAEGRMNKEIARTLSISPKTVEKHRANLMRKLDHHNTSQVTRFAVENGLLPGEVTTPSRAIA